MQPLHMRRVTSLAKALGVGSVIGSVTLVTESHCVLGGKKKKKENRQLGKNVFGESQTEISKRKKWELPEISEGTQRICCEANRY